MSVKAGGGVWLFTDMSRGIFRIYLWGPYFLGLPFRPYKRTPHPHETYFCRQRRSEVVNFPNQWFGLEIGGATNIFLGPLRRMERRRPNIVWYGLTHSCFLIFSYLYHWPKLGWVKRVASGHVRKSVTYASVRSAHVTSPWQLSKLIYNGTVTTNKVIHSTNSEHRIENLNFCHWSGLINDKIRIITGLP